MGEDAMASLLYLDLGQASLFIYMYGVKYIDLYMLMCLHAGNVSQLTRGTEEHTWAACRGGRRDRD
jgi:hypothetical protein